MTLSTADHWCIAVLAGGDSEEAVISRFSGASVQAALMSRGHTVVPIDPAEVNLAGVDWSQFDAAFIALHGRFGEDGQVQSILDAASIPYTGSDAATSRLTFSKSAAKERMSQFSVATPNSVVIHRQDSPERIQRTVELIGFPLVIKPDAQGSSLGVTIVRHAGEVQAALDLCFSFDDFGLVEQYIDGKEWTVGLLDDMVMPPLLIETSRPFFDYHAKYEDESTNYRFDSDWSLRDLDLLQDTALAACRALGTRGLVRVDLRTDASRVPWVLEVNTIPGLTVRSMVPKAAAQMGIDFAELCERAILSACRAQPPRPHHLQNRTVRPMFQPDTRNSGR